jgi:hypothetical protein
LRLVTPALPSSVRSSRPGRPRLPPAALATEAGMVARRRRERLVSVHAILEGQGQVTEARA